MSRIALRKSQITVNISTTKLREQFHIPPIHDWTPYQIHAITARFKIGQREPQTPNEALIPTGKETW
jgi:hypothetical protein